MEHVSFGCDVEVRALLTAIDGVDDVAILLLNSSSALRALLCSQLGELGQIEK
jgi:hypothetical protein